jgi:heme/copper-type cytochrome/quinol oxidase subunit 2
MKRLQTSLYLKIAMGGRTVKYRIFIPCLSLIFFISLTTALSSAEGPPVIKILPDGTQRMEIIADSYSFSPDHLVINLNTPVELIMRNKSWLVPHNFILKDLDAGLNIKRDIPTGKSTVVKFTPTRPGKFKFYCDKKLLFFKSHEDKGMKGIIEVEGMKVPEIPSMDPTKPEGQ